MTSISILGVSRLKISYDHDPHFSIKSAAIAFNVIFAIWAAYQTLICLRVLYQSKRRLSYTILLFAIFFSLADDIMSAVEISIDYKIVYDSSGGTNEQFRIREVFPPIFFLMWHWVYVQTDILLALALIVHILRWMSRLSREIAAKPATTLLSIKSALDGLLILIWTVIMIAALAVSRMIYNEPYYGIALGSKSTRIPVVTVGGLVYNQFYNGLVAKSTMLAAVNLAYARHAFQAATTFDIAISALVLWKQMKRMKISDKSITYIAFIITPVLLIRVLFLIASDIITSQALKEGTDDFSWASLDLVAMILENVAIYIAIFMLLAGADRACAQEKKEVENQ